MGRLRARPVACADLAIFQFSWTVLVGLGRLIYVLLVGWHRMVLPLEPLGADNCFSFL